MHWLGTQARLVQFTSNEGTNITVGQRTSLPVMTLGCLNFKNVILRNYADNAGTVSSRLVDFQKTHFHDPVR